MGSHTCTDGWGGPRCGNGQYRIKHTILYYIMSKVQFLILYMQLSVTPCVPMEGLVLVLGCAAAFLAMEGRDARNVS